jgi:hypothetical protein
LRICEHPALPASPAFLPKPPTGAQEDIWNLVWHRRMAYFATLAFSTLLVLFPFIPTETKDGGISSPLSFISPIIRLIGVVLPGFASFWIDAFVANPGWLLFGIGGVVFMMLRGASVAARITDEMRTIWTRILIAEATPEPPHLNSWIYRVRTDECYRSMLWELKRHILPVIFAILFVYLGVVAIIRPIFAVADSTGFVCPAADSSSLAAANSQFRTDAFCWDSRTVLDPDTRYTITLTRATGDEPWKDGEKIETDFGGYGVEKMRLWQYLTWPLRRSLAEPWFKPIARIGNKGADEYVLDSARPVSKKDLKQKLVAEITTRTKGQLYLYVNDAIGIPFSFFYGHGYENPRAVTVDIRKTADLQKTTAAPTNTPANAPAR